MRPEDLRSAEIVQQDDIAGGAATSDQQFFMVRRPTEVEDLAGTELRKLFWFSSAQWLLPNVGYPIPVEEVLQFSPIR